MKMLRQDLSKWALHFIHDVNLENESEDRTIQFDLYGGYPYHEDKELNDRFDLWKVSDDHYLIDTDACALQVLLKIITDGHIRATWAFRGNRPTIYGPRAAVCFTEMPLYALLEYAKQRKNDSVRDYAVGILKEELFAAGGRPVIYGLSGRHVEQGRVSPLNKGWPRKLASSCGIAESEQYRYVAMSSDPERPIDWSHEREWRWVDHDDRCFCPGLPVWLSEEPFLFSRVFLVVPDAMDAKRALERLKELHDAGANDFDYPFSRETLEATSVIALDQLERDVSDGGAGQLRLDDIPALYISDFERPKATAELVDKVRSVLAKAKAAADQAAAAHLESSPRASGGRRVADVAGWAHLVVYDAQSALVSALLELGEAYCIPGTGYYIKGIGGLGWKQEQALSLAEAAVSGAKTVFEAHFPCASFGIETRWD